MIAATPENIRMVLTAIMACPDRGSVLPIRLQCETCQHGVELTECRAGKGATPGRVTTGDCTACRYEFLDRQRP